MKNSNSNKLKADTLEAPVSIPGKLGGIERFLKGEKGKGKREKGNNGKGNEERRLRKQIKEESFDPRDVARKNCEGTI